MSLAAVVSLCAGRAGAEVSSELDPITVVSLSRVADESSRRIAGAAEFSAAEADTLSRVLDRAASFDVRSRGAFGIQQDVSLRGATFDQSGVYLEGVPLADPQTGHHSFDLPFTLFDVARLDQLPPGTAAFSGLAGGVGVRLKDPLHNGSRAMGYFGQHGLFGEGASFSRFRRGLGARISFEHAQAKAARPDTEFDSGTGTAHAAYESGKRRYEAFFGYQEKEFGAANFYSNLFPREEERTDTLLVRLSAASLEEEGPWKHTALWRRHGDTFILQKEFPSRQNIHTTHMYGIVSERTIPFDTAQIDLSGMLKEERITSSNLGRHSRWSAGTGARARVRPGAGLRLEAGAAPAYFSQQRMRYAGDVLLGWDAIEDTLSFSASYARSYRLPTFTELYYRDAANRGNPGLGTERADTFALNATCALPQVHILLEPFLRQSRDLIDWTRARSTDPWDAANIGRVEVRGVEAGVTWKPRQKGRGVRISEAAFSYIYMEPRNDPGDLLSKYALDIVRHKAAGTLTHRVCGLDFSWAGTYVSRRLGEEYFLLDLGLSRQMAYPSCTVTPFISGTNLNNAHYREAGGVVQPGRWLRAGVRIDF